MAEPQIVCLLWTLLVGRLKGLETEGMMVKWTEDSTVTVGDMVHLLRFVLIEVMGQAKSTSRAADESLIEIANVLGDLSSKTTDTKIRFMLSALSQKLIETEPGSNPGDV
jgi:hypothetical protein